VKEAQGSLSGKDKHISQLQSARTSLPDMSKLLFMHGLSLLEPSIWEVPCGGDDLSC